MSNYGEVSIFSCIIGSISGVLASIVLGIFLSFAEETKIDIFYFFITATTVFSVITGFMVFVTRGILFSVVAFTVTMISFAIVSFIEFGFISLLSFLLQHNEIMTNLGANAISTIIALIITAIITKHIVHTGKLVSG